MSLAVGKDQIAQIKHASVDDPVLQVLRNTIHQGWSENKTQVPPVIRAYYDFRDELTVQDQLVIMIIMIFFFYNNRVPKYQYRPFLLCV